MASKPPRTGPATKLVYSTGSDLRKTAQPAPQSSPRPTPAVIRVYLDTKRRKGKTMTAAAGFTHGDGRLDDLCRRLKAQCGAGGTVEDAIILIQGDHRDKVAAFLEAQGLRVRKS